VQYCVRVYVCLLASVCMCEVHVHLCLWGLNIEGGSNNMAYEKESQSLSPI